MKRAYAVKINDDDIRRIMMDTYINYQNIYTTIYVNLTDGSVRTCEHVSENSYYADRDLYPVWTCNPVKQYADDREEIYPAELMEWAFMEYRDALHWAESEDDADEE